MRRHWLKIICNPKGGECRVQNIFFIQGISSLSFVSYNSFIHSRIYIAPLQGNYSEVQSAAIISTTATTTTTIVYYYNYTGTQCPLPKWLLFFLLIVSCR